MLSSADVMSANDCESLADRSLRLLALADMALVTEFNDRLAETLADASAETLAEVLAEAEASR